MGSKIRNAELIGPKCEIVNSDGHVDYDMFLVKVTYADGKVRKVRTFAEPGTLDITNNADVRKFIYARLENLMEESGRTNYIFLGKLLPPGEKYVADRFYEVDGQEALDVFEENVFDLRDAIEQKEAQKKAEKQKKKEEKAKAKAKKKEEKTKVKAEKKESKTQKEEPTTRERLFPEKKQEPFVHKFSNPPMTNDEKKKGQKGEAPQREPIRRATFLPTPKHYVLGDAHGFYGTYIEAMRHMTSFDKAYIIGDVVDRGPDGIKILEDIMRRTKYQNSGPQVTFIMGNHEMQMLESIDIIEKAGLNGQDISNYMQVGRWSYFKNLCLKDARDIEKKSYHSDRDKKEIEENKRIAEIHEGRMKAAMKEAARSNKKITEGEARLLYIWLDANGGIPTINAYLRLPEERRRNIRKFLEDSPVMIKESVDTKKYLMVHASPCAREDVLTEFEKNPKCELKYKSIRYFPSIVSEMLESRGKTQGFEMWKEKGYRTIYGHTPQHGKIVENPEENSINIDAGCGHGYNLALYCIEDNKAVFFDQKVESEKVKPVFDGYEDR